MKVYFANPGTALSVDRVVKALRGFLPIGTIKVDNIEEADLVVLHVAGRHDNQLRQAEKIKQAGAQYAVIQYALKSTRNPDPKEWLTLWNGAKVVWSYYDLSRYIKNLYHAPLGADPTFFYPQEAKKDYLVGTLGIENCYQTECFGEVHLAAYLAGGKVVHVGKLANENPIVDVHLTVDDDELCAIYNRCKWFSALRRKDGFEMTAVEALLCGTRPIMFGTENYRQWFDGLAEFIPEGRTPAEAVHSLTKIFKGKPSPVTDDEIKEAKKRFDWYTNITGFWERCLT